MELYELDMNGAPTTCVSITGLHELVGAPGEAIDVGCDFHFADERATALFSRLVSEQVDWAGE